MQFNENTQMINVHKKYDLCLGAVFEHVFFPDGCSKELPEIGLPDGQNLS